MGLFDDLRGGSQEGEQLLDFAEDMPIHGPVFEFLGMGTPREQRIAQARANTARDKALQIKQAQAIEALQRDPQLFSESVDLSRMPSREHGQSAEFLRGQLATEGGGGRLSSSTRRQRSQSNDNRIRGQSELARIMREQRSQPEWHEAYTAPDQTIHGVDPGLLGFDVNANNPKMRNSKWDKIAGISPVTGFVGSALDDAGVWDWSKDKLGMDEKDAMAAYFTMGTSTPFSAIKGARRRGRDGDKGRPHKASEVTPYKPSKG